eukprot:57885_1
MSESTKWTYKWEITDPSTIKQMKNAKNLKGWTSPMFTVCGFRWNFQVYPNGQITDNKGYINFYVALAFLPPKVKSVVVVETYGLLEVDEITNATNKYEEECMSWGWYSDQLATVKVRNLNKLTFVVKMELAGVFDKNDNDITNQYISHEEAKQNQSQEQQQLVEA